MDGTDTDENGINDSEENLEIIPMIAAGKDKEIKERENCMDVEMSATQG